MVPHSKGSKEATETMGEICASYKSDKGLILQETAIQIFMYKDAY